MSTSKRKLKSFLFDVGDSNAGPVGFCVRVRARSKSEALRKLRERIPECVNAVEGDDDEIEYLNVYFNPDAISLSNLQESETEEVE